MDSFDSFSREDLIALILQQRQEIEQLRHRVEMLPSRVRRSHFARWDELFGIDLRSLAAFRIGVALFVLADLLMRATDYEVHYTNNGILPIDAVLKNGMLGYGNFLPLYMMSTNFWWAGFLFAVTALLAVALLLGWRTRTATVLVWYLVTSLHARNPMILNGADVFLRMQLLWAIFLPLGARWSLDAKGKTGKKPPRPANGEPEASRPVRAYSVATVGLLLQVCMVYWFTAILKSDPVWRVTGTAVQDSLRIEQYQTAVGAYLLHFPALLRYLTFATVYFEGFGVLLAFVPYRNGIFRTFAVALFLGFHLVALNLSFDLGMLPYVSAAAWLAFLPTDFWEWVAARRSRTQPTDEPAAPARPLGLPRFGSILAGFLLIYVLLWNLRTVWYDRFSPLLPPQADIVAKVTRVDQFWALFAPKPMTNDGWYVVPARLHDGSKVDLFRGGAPMTWKKPFRISTLYKNERWRKYMMQIWSSQYPEERKYYGQYLCSTWNRDHTGGKQVETFQVYFMRKDILPDGKEFKPIPVLLWTHYCHDTPANHRNLPAPPPPM